MHARHLHEHRASVSVIPLMRDELRDTNAKIVNIIHDEIVVETDADHAEEIAAKVERVMCAAGAEYLKTVPVKVETEIADEWVK